ncbi:hypothetical protein H0H81_004439, partial [Sphagnurus paluster]
MFTVENFEEDSSQPGGIGENNSDHGGNVILAYKIARLVGCLTLLGLTVYSSVISEKDSGSIVLCGKQQNCTKLAKKGFSNQWWLILGMCITYVSKPSWSMIASRHISVLLLVTFAVIFYRDIYPLATYTRSPMDLSEGWALWAKYIDPYNGSKKQHLFWGLMRVFRREYTIMAVMIVIEVAANFTSPVGIKNLLHYIETQGEKASVRPWFWICWLIAGPVTACIAGQWYVYIVTRTVVRAECIITQLIFEHSLRIRVKAEIDPGSPSATPNPSTPVTPHTSLVVDTPSHKGDSSVARSTSEHHSELTGSTEAEIQSRHSQDESIPSSSSAINSDISKLAKGKGSQKSPKEEAKSRTPDHLVGKINNLVTTDLSNIVGSRDFLVLLLNIPLQIVLCIVFLYFLLGWSAFVGLSTIIALLPIPGYVTKHIRDVQVVRLKTTDARVQTVNETMNALRMVKLFGWEKKTHQRVTEKRDKEL